MAGNKKSNQPEELVSCSDCGRSGKSVLHTVTSLSGTWRKINQINLRSWYLALIADDLKLTIYIYWVWRETWRLVQPRKFILPKGEARGRHGFSLLNKSSCLLTNWEINCLLHRKLKENLLSRKHVLNQCFAYFSLSFSVNETWHAKHVLWGHSPSHRSAVPWDTTGRDNVWRETQQFVFSPRDCARPILFLHSSYQFYEV